MLTVPEVSGVDAVFGNIRHMPKYDTLPDEYQQMRGIARDAVSSWFFSGAKAIPTGLEIDGVKWTAREGVDHVKALRAIKAVLCSFEPKHEHKIGGCGFMLNEWFEPSTVLASASAK